MHNCIIIYKIFKVSMYKNMNVEGEIFHKYKYSNECKGLKMSRVYSHV